MEEFSYLSVLLSIIIGLAVAQVLTGLRGRMLSRTRVRTFWPVDLWAGILLLIAAQSWWAMFDLRSRQNWEFDFFFILLLQTIFLYLLAGLVYPDFPPNEATDLRSHYFAQRRHFFTLTIAAGLISILKDLVLNHTLPDPANLGFHLLFLVLAALALMTTREWFHQSLALVVAGLYVTYIITLFARLR